MSVRTTFNPEIISAHAAGKLSRQRTRLLSEISILTKGKPCLGGMHTFLRFRPVLRMKAVAFSAWTVHRGVSTAL